MPPPTVYYLLTMLGTLLKDLLERSINFVNKSVNDEGSLEKIDSEELMKQQQNLVRELEQVRSQLQVSQMVSEQQKQLETRALLFN